MSVRLIARTCKAWAAARRLGGAAGGVHASPHGLAAGAPELTHRAGGDATVGAAAFAVHEASARLGRDDRAPPIDARAAAMPTVGDAAFGVHASPHASAAMTRGW